MRHETNSADLAWIHATLGSSDGRGLAFHSYGHDYEVIGTVPPDRETPFWRIASRNLNTGQRVTHSIDSVSASIATALDGMDR